MTSHRSRSQRATACSPSGTTVQQRGNHDLIHRIVFHRQDAYAGQALVGLRRRVDRLPGFRIATAGERNGGREGGAFAFDASGLDATVHEPRKLSADGEAKPFAPKATGRRCIDLFELVKQTLEPGRRHPHTGVGDREHQVGFDAGDLHGGAPAIRELHRIRQKAVGDANRITTVDAVGRSIDLELEADALLVGPGGEGAMSPAHQRAEIELGVLQGKLTGLDLGEVEDVVEDREQRLARLPDQAETLALDRPERVGGHRRAMPRRPFSGARISWLIVARNALLA
jgi:hypothetical protein